MNRYLFYRGDYQVEVRTTPDEVRWIKQEWPGSGYESRQLSAETDEAKQAAVVCEEARGLVGRGWEFRAVWLDELPHPDVAALLHELDPLVGFSGTLDGDPWLRDPSAVGLAPLRSLTVGVEEVRRGFEAVAASSVERLRISLQPNDAYSAADRTVDARQLPAGLKVLDFTGLTLANPEALARPSLAEVTVSFDVGGALLDVGFVAGSPALRKLAVHARGVTHPEAISEATGLEHLQLHLEGGVWPVDLRPLSALKYLSAYAPLRLETLEAPGLEYLHFHGDLERGIEGDLAEVGRFPKLRHIGYRGVGEKAPASLAECLELEVVDLGTEILDFDALEGLQHLKRINIPDLDAVMKATSRPAVFDKPGLEVVFTVSGDELHWGGPRLARLMRGELKLPTRNDVKRPALMLKSKRGDPGPLGSGFGITPYLAPGEAWPTAADGRPLHLVLQLDLAQLGEGEEGLFQFFALLDDPELPPYTDLERMLFRVVKPEGAPAKVEVPKFSVAIKPRTITDLKPRSETPGHEDWGRLLLKGNAGKPKAGDKAGGWPDWIQSPEWPQDEGGEDLAFFLQIDSNMKTGLVWGDAGQAYIFRSKRDPTVFGFCWQSG